MRSLHTMAAALAGLALTAGAAVADTIVPVNTPEPASMALLAVGVGGVALVRTLRRRSRRPAPSRATTR